jgi:hypothetical protein
VDKKESSQVKKTKPSQDKQINERQSKMKKERNEKEAWRTKEIRKRFVGLT